MVLARNLAALLALACVGFAVGDWARAPNAAGLLGLIALVAVFGFLLAYLFKPRRARPPRPAPDPVAPPPPPPPPEPEPSAAGRPRRRRPSLSAPPAGWDDDRD